MKQSIMKTNKIINIPLQFQLKKFMIVRHGESVWNHDNRFTGWTNIPLTTIGIQEAKNMAKSLEQNKLVPNIMFSSVLNRCMTTSNIIRKKLDIENVPFHTSWRLNEKHYGSLEGIPREKIRKIYGDKLTSLMRSNFYMKPLVLDENDDILKSNQEESFSVFKNCYFESVKYGESKEDVLNRLLPFYQNDILYHVNDNYLPLIVTHKHCIRVLFKHMLNLTDIEFDNFKILDNSIYIVSLDNELNYFKHEIIEY